MKESMRMKTSQSARLKEVEKKLFPTFDKAIFRLLCSKETYHPDVIKTAQRALMRQAYDFDSNIRNLPPKCDTPIGHCLEKSAQYAYVIKEYYANVRSRGST